MSAETPLVFFLRVFSRGDDSGSAAALEQIGVKSLIHSQPPELAVCRRIVGNPEVILRRFLAASRIGVEKSAYHHVSQSEIDALAQGIVEIIVEIVVRTGELQGLKPEFLRSVLCRP